jgi:NAD(P)-dependent dehydrogenase (short-subunit alcohol dehydrogenase family)
MSKRLDGKVAVVTGGGSGIGLAAARRLAAEGASVFIAGRRRAELEEAAATIGHAATPVRCDVSDLADLDRLFAAVERQAGRIDVLFANAGVPTAAPLGGVAEAEFDRVFGINAKGLFFTAQKALPLLAAGGSIVLNASIAGSRGHPMLSVYSATKAAVRSFARCWAAELGPRGIRVNVVSPGLIDTPIFDDAGASREEVEGFKADVVAATPLGRIGTPDEVAGAVAFLASDESSYITGIELFVDGGEGQI